MALTCASSAMPLDNERTEDENAVGWQGKIAPSSGDRGRADRAWPRNLGAIAPRLCGAITHLARPHAPPRRSRKKGSSYKSNEKHASHVGGDDMHPRAVTIQDPNPTIQDPDLLRRFAGGIP